MGRERHLSFPFRPQENKCRWKVRKCFLLVLWSQRQCKESRQCKIAMPTFTNMTNAHATLFIYYSNSLSGEKHLDLVNSGITLRKKIPILSLFPQVGHNSEQWTFVGVKNIMTSLVKCHDFPSDPAYANNNPTLF